MTGPDLATLGILAFIIILYILYYVVLASNDKRVSAAQPSTVGLSPGEWSPLRSPHATSVDAPPPTLPTDTLTVSGLTKTQAEEFLDWLEAHGCRHYELCRPTPQGYTIHYRWPAA
jgi:hypothetical protein